MSNAQEQIDNRSALRVIVRAMGYSLRYKYELAVKMTTQMTSIFWILFLPWPAKIVIDYVVLGDTNPESDAVIPFFFEPAHDFAISPLSLGLNQDPQWDELPYEEFLKESLAKFAEYDRG